MKFQTREKKSKVNIEVQKYDFVFFTCTLSDLSHV